MSKKLALGTQDVTVRTLRNKASIPLLCNYLQKMEASNVRPEHQFDEISLDKYLTTHLHGYPSNTNENLIVRQYRYNVFNFEMLEYLQIYNDNKHALLCCMCG